MKTRYYGLIGFGIGVLIAVWSIVYTQDYNTEHTKNTWYQNATVIEKYNKWYGYDCIIQTDDGKRYIDTCKVSMVGDVLELKMYKDYLVSAKRVG